MKAVCLHDYGGVEHLRYEDVPDPVPGPNEVLVRLSSTSVNPIDYKLRSGSRKDLMTLELPAILGRDLAGMVTQVGEGVEKFQAGDLVMGLVNHTYAELVVAPAHALTHIPQGLDPCVAGVLPLVTQTGAQLIEEGVRPIGGDVILVTGALGGVGRTAVYVARQRGATVIAGVRQKQLAAAQSLGAELVVAIDQEDELPNMPDVDAIADTVGGDTVVRLLARLRSKGRLASVVGKPEGARNLDVRPVWSHPDPPCLHQLAEAVRDRAFQIPIFRRLHLADIREAHQLAERGVEGKIALTP